SSRFFPKRRPWTAASDKTYTFYYAADERERAGKSDAAAGLYGRILGLHAGRLDHPDLYALSHLALGRIAESCGDTANARQFYQKFIKLWITADPGLPEVEEAKTRLAALSLAH
ncbi:MAG: tetratricopeptide repeat protein, partial [Candidatus Aminicenantales bacterium]